MENEVVILSETNGKDVKNAVEVLVSEERVEARAVFASEGRKRNELEEEVFEEAEEYMLEQGMESDIRDDLVGQERKLEATDDFLAGVDAIPSVGDKPEKSEVAIGVSGKVGEAEQEIAPAAEVVGDLTEMNNDNGVAVVKGIDDGGTDVQLIPDEVNRLSHDGFLGGGEDEGKCILDILVDGETEAPNGVVGGGEDGGKEISENHAVGEIVAENGLGAGGVDGEKEISEIGSSGRVEATDYSVVGEDGEEGTAKVGAGSKIEASNGVFDAGVSSFTTIDDSTSEKDNVDSVNVEQVSPDEDPHNKVDDVDSHQETLSNKDVSNIASNSLEACQNTFDVDDKGGVIEQQKDSASPSLELHDVRVPKMCETNNATGHEDYNNNKLNDFTSGVDSIDHDDSGTELRDIYIIAEQKDQDIKEVKDFSVDPSIMERPEMVLGSAQASREQETQPAHQPASSSEMSPNLAPPPARPAGLGRGAPLLEPGARVVQQSRLNGSASQVQNQQIEEPINGDPEESDETREKLQMIRVKFLRLAHRLGQTPHNVVVAQVLYRLGLAEQLRGRNGGRVGAFSFDRASAMAEQLEAAGNEPLDFSCTIMVLGKTGVGKSATINSIFDEMKFNTDAFQTGTKKVQDVVGTVQGIKIRVIDTPGLFSSWADQRQNEKILHSVKHFIKNTPPDIVLYLDRLDMQSRDFSDMPLLRNITDIFGPSIWFNAIVVLTHAASAPPEGPNGTASSYDMFVTQRSHVVQQAIRQAAGDMRLMNPVSLVENHSACRTNRAGQRVLPNGQVWKPHLLLLSFASKILAEANALLKLQDTSPGKPYTTRSRAPPLPFLLSSLLQSRPQLKLPEEQFGDNDSLDDDLDESSDSDDESEFDELPPFRRLTKTQVEKLSKAQKKAYFDELEYREKLFMKKQLKEEKKRRKLMKKMADSVKDLPSEYNESAEEEGAGAGAASVPVPMPDLALPASFDSDNPTHRFRYLDSSNQWLVRPVLETHGWDHDIGYEGINVERSFVVKNKMPLSFSGQITKDKKDANVQMEVASSIKHGENKATSLGFDMQTVGKDLAYTLRSETRFSNFRRNKATAGVSITQMGDALSAGVKVEDKLIANKRFWLVMTGGAMTGRGDVAYGGSLEAQLRDKDYPLGRSLSTLGLSVMDWHGDLAIGCNIQSQIPVGRNSNLVARANLNNRGAGQVSIRLNSSEQLQIALVGLIPLLRKLHGYSQQLQYGQ